MASDVTRFHHSITPSPSPSPNPGFSPESALMEMACDTCIYQVDTGVVPNDVCGFGFDWVYILILIILDLLSTI